VSNGGSPLKNGYLSAAGLSNVKWLQIGTDMLLNITSTGDGFIGLSTLMTLSDLES